MTHDRIATPPVRTSLIPTPGNAGPARDSRRRVVWCSFGLTWLLSVACGGGSDGQTIAATSAPGRAPEPGAPPGTCSDEMQRALRYFSGLALLPREWEGVPFRYDVIQSQDPEVTSYLRDQLSVVEVLAARIEERLGYPIIEAGGVIAPPRGLPPDWPSTPEDLDAHCRAARSPGQAIGFLMPERPGSHRGGGASSASPHCAAVTYYRHRDGRGLIPEFKEAVVHELFHLFGFKHDDARDLERAGIFMSSDLSGRIFGTGEDWRVTLADLDALGCVFPHPHFPR